MHNPANYSGEDAHELKNGKLPKKPKQKKTMPGIPREAIAKRKASRRERTMTMFADAGGTEVILRQVGA
jgi:hypothetical protein